MKKSDIIKQCQEIYEEHMGKKCSKEDLLIVERHQMIDYCFNEYAELFEQEFGEDIAEQFPEYDEDKGLTYEIFEKFESENMGDVQMIVCDGIFISNSDMLFVEPRNWYYIFWDFEDYPDPVLLDYALHVGKRVSKLLE